jgi:hypothetical protein
MSNKKKGVEMDDIWDTDMDEVGGYDDAAQQQAQADFAESEMNDILDESEEQDIKKRRSERFTGENVPEQSMEEPNSKWNKFKV